MEEKQEHSPNDTIALLEATDFGAYLVDLASDITSEDCGPLLNEDTDILHVAVEGIDGNGCVLDDNLTGTCFGERGIADLERGAGLVEPGCLILWCRHVFDGQMLFLMKIRDCCDELCWGLLKSGGRWRK